MGISKRFGLMFMLSLAVCSAVFTTSLAAVPLPPTGQAGNNSKQGIAQSQLKKVRLRATQDDLASIRVVDLKNGTVFRVYFDEGSAQVAEDSVPVLAAFYRELAEIIGIDGGRVDWSSVAFVQNPEYNPPRRGGEVRWKVLVESNGQIGPAGINDLYLVLPHEQVHAIQGTFTGDLPRWFKEGQATWAGLKVTERWRPELARKERAGLTQAHKAANEPLKLPVWGGVRVKPEAILRQLTPEQRERMLKDPTYEAPGPFTFGQGDFISDESSARARYGASLDVFERLEQSAGRKVMHAWFRSAWQQGSDLKTEKLVTLAREQTKVDISQWVK
jgi:hypothetical protein